MDRAAKGTVPALEIGGTHVTAALVDLQAGAVLAGSVAAGQSGPFGECRSAPRCHHRLRPAITGGRRAALGRGGPRPVRL